MKIVETSRESGSVVLMVVMLLGLVTLLIAMNQTTLNGLQREMLLLNQQHQQRLLESGNKPLDEKRNP